MLPDSPETGLALARDFFTVSKPLLMQTIPDIMEASAVGLVGEGSECFGCDDSFSRDHDWGPAFCLWVDDETLYLHRTRIEQALAALPSSFAGYPTRMTPEKRMGRVGPLGVRAFYAHFIGLEQAPVSGQEWRALSEQALAACTNGAIFQTGNGQFEAIRSALLLGYPDDILRKKLTARCMIMAQSGQYNLPRSLMRQEWGTAMLCAARFAEAALSMTFLLNRRFMPFYKWAHRLVRPLPLLGVETAELLEQLSRIRFPFKDEGLVGVKLIEQHCASVAVLLREQGWTQEQGDWLWTLGIGIHAGIHSKSLRELDLMQD